MDAVIGRVTGREVKQNIDSSGDKLVLQVEVTDPDDVQSIQLMPQGGEDYNPPNDSQVLILPVTDRFKVAIAADDGITSTMAPGERKMYSTSAGAIAAFINLLDTGIIEINGNGEFAIGFNAMKTAFDEMVSDFNAHTHTGVTTGTGVSGTPSTPSNADMAAAKIDEVKLP